MIAEKKIDNMAELQTRKITDFFVDDVKNYQL